MSALPGIHPEPPDTLAGRELPLRHVASPWVRCHRSRYDPLHFGRTGAGRFDDPMGEYGVLYASRDAYGAFVETFGRLLDVRAVTTSALLERSLSWIEATRPLALVDLSGSGLARIGADARLTTADYAVAQRWARALWAHPVQPDGLYFLARHDPSRPSAALFDRAADALRVTDQRRFRELRDDPLLRDILATYGFDALNEDDA